MFKVVLTGLVATTLIVCVSICLADETKKVTLKDGSSVLGQVTNTATGYEVKTRYGAFQYTFDQVATVADIGSPQDEYQQRLAKIDPKSAQDHFDLAKWASTNGLLETALAEVEQALKIKPGNDEYDALRRQIEARIKLEATATTRGGAAPGPKVGEPASPQKPLLSDQDMAVVRQAELSLDPRVAESPTVEFKNKCLENVMAAMNPKDAKALKNQAPIEQARFMLANAASFPGIQGLANDVVIKGNPKVLADFQSKVWPVVQGSCASTACHATEKGKGGLKLFNISGDKDKLAVTNFVLLDGYVNKDGLRMIDRDHPERSLLLQYGLAASEAQVPHPSLGAAGAPSIPIANPPFKTARSDAYQKVYDWILELKMPHPDYPIKYQPPAGMTFNFGGDVGGVTTKPATPASAPATRPSTPPIQK
jgi:hypothetical protein